MITETIDGTGARKGAPNTLLRIVLILTLLGIGAGGLWFKEQLQRKHAMAMSLQCRSHLNQLALAVLLYSSDHEDRAPKSWDEVLKYLPSTRALFCPATNAVVAGTVTSNPPVAAATYPLEVTGLLSGNALQILTRCPLHGHAVRSDQMIVSGGI